MNLRELRQLSAKNELSLNFIAKDLMLSKLLFQLQNIPNIILKGGTAINRVYLKDERRFSEDIDLDLITNQDVKSSIEITNKIINQIKGFEIEKPRIMHSTIRYDLYYINPLEHKDKIRLEFTIKNRKEKHSKKIINFGFVPYEASLLDVYEKEILIKHKIDCLISRNEGKDIYDLYYILNKNLNLDEIIKQKINAKLNLSSKEIKQIANIANHYLPKNLRPNWNLFIQKLKNKLLK